MVGSRFVKAVGLANEWHAALRGRLRRRLWHAFCNKVGDRARKEDSRPEETTISLPKDHTVTCPECGHEQPIVLWRTIDGGLDPELRDLLVDGELNVFRCEVCAIEAFYTLGTLLYTDSARGYAVQYYPPAILEHDELMVHSFDCEGRVAPIGPPEDASSWYEQDAPHVVFDYGELIRYIRFRERLHDLMELPVGVPLPHGLPEIEFGSPEVPG